MKRFERFVFRGRLYKFLAWEQRGVALAAEATSGKQAVLAGVPATARECECVELMRQIEMAKTRQQRTKLSTSVTDDERKRLEEEAWELVRTIPGLKQLAIDSILHSDSDS